jgi:uncharacterized protein HemX
VADRKQRAAATRRTPRKPRTAAPEAEDLVPRLSAHPRAQRQIALAKAWAAIAVLALVVALGLRAGTPLFDALARGLAVGALAYLGAWALGIALWRHVAQAELEIAREKAETRRREAEEEAERARAEASAAA